jgi:phosphatidylinositol alpha-1,6-mannosyltransferase
VSYQLSALVLLIVALVQQRPTRVLAGSGVTALLARLAGWLSRCPYAVMVHGLDLVTPHRVYRALALPAVRAADTVIANSNNTARLARTVGVNEQRLQILPPGVQYPAAPADGESFRARFELSDRPVLLSVGRLVPRKGLARFVECALPRILARYPEAVLAIVGEAPKQALAHEATEGQAIEAAAERAAVQASIRFCGRVDDDMLASAYQAADLMIFPVLDVPGDVEGFGMVAVEAAAYGVPTFGFRAGGLEDAVLSGETGELVAPGAYGELADTICSHLDRKDRDGYRDACLSHAARHCWSRYGSRLGAALDASRQNKDSLHEGSR